MARISGRRFRQPRWRSCRQPPRRYATLDCDGSHGTLGLLMRSGMKIYPLDLAKLWIQYAAAKHFEEEVCVWLGPVVSRQSRFFGLSWVVYVLALEFLPWLEVDSSRPCSTNKGRRAVLALPAFSPAWALPWVFFFSCLLRAMS